MLNDKATISKAMSLLGSRSTPAKRAACRSNGRQPKRSPEERLKMFTELRDKRGYITPRQRKIMTKLIRRVAKESNE